MSGRGAGSVANATNTPRPASTPTSTPAPGRASTGDVATPGRRTYDASGRRAAAERRRAHVVETASRLFAAHGWSGTTIAALAREAQVSPEYVTKTFGGKQALLMEAVRSASFGRSASLPAAYAGLRLGDEPDREVRLDRFVDFVCDSVEPMAPFLPAMNQGAADDERMRTILGAARGGHVDIIRAVVPLLAPGPVRPDAVDEVVVLTRGETYLVFAAELGWTRERYAAWLRRSIDAAVTG
ncbi:TetR/AcrR family transcriptional regulator [Nocardioides sp. Soil774]|uniref:TetR/AcrR family transcriptional regulator n=1 Tax=Nocardioides sp. Soil774 TaxID=1736408 RepID=UPI00138F6126|nr:helix-turn-helix domain-containing protein [Nocardioides sp. Soil774]